jgi:hypothetical protein
MGVIPAHHHFRPEIHGDNMGNTQRMTRGGFLKWGYPISSSILIRFSIINNPSRVPHCRKPPYEYGEYGDIGCWGSVIIYMVKYGEY